MNIRFCALLLACAMMFANIGVSQANVSSDLDKVKEQLVDPDSAKFERIQSGPTGATCGFINAKNSFGGYTGKKAFSVYNGTVYIVDIKDIVDGVLKLGKDNGRDKDNERFVFSWNILCPSVMTDIGKMLPH